MREPFTKRGEAFIAEEGFFQSNGIKMMSQDPKSGGEGEGEMEEEAEIPHPSPPIPLPPFPTNDATINPREQNRICILFFPRN